MAYSESKKLTDSEKRMQALKTQLFGKEGVQIKSSANTQTDQENKNIKPFITTSSNQSQDLTYLKYDLIKIFILATLAIGFQLILYIQFTFKFLRFN